MLTDHEAIRAWAAARMGVPAMRPAAPLSVGRDEPVITFLFDTIVYPDQSSSIDRPPTVSSPEEVEWDEWFRIFDERGLALVVAEDRPNVVDPFYEFVVR